MKHCHGCNKKHDDYNWKYDGKHWWCSKWHRPTRPEFMPDRIKDDRVEYFNSIVQPYRQGELSKEYIDVYGTEGLEVTPEEAKRAKNVWKGEPGWNSRKQSK